MASNRPPEIYIVDVFAASRLGGNPAAVVVGAEDGDSDRMQRLARFLNLSETVFLFPPEQSGADFRARTFTVRREIPFAGHASLAAAHIARLRRPDAAQLVQECSAGLLAITLPVAGADEYTLQLPSPQVRRTTLTTGEIGEALQLAQTTLGARTGLVGSAGPEWLLVELANLADLQAMTAGAGRIAALSAAVDAVGLAAFHCRADGSIELRGFAPSAGIIEDPVCGSCAAAVSAVLAEEGSTGRIAFRQGATMLRSGIMSIEICRSEASVTINLIGRCTTEISGAITQPL